MKTRLESVFIKIWNQLGDNSKDILKEGFGQPQEYLTDEFKEVVERMEEFKKGTIDFNDYLRLVIQSVEYI